MKQRILESVALIAIWMGAGWLLHLDANAYLLLGVPLVLAFQKLVRKKPIAALWVDGGRFRLPAVGWVLAALLAAWPTLTLAAVATSQWNWTTALWLLAAIGGAVAAAFAILEQRSRPFAAPLAYALTAMVLGLAVFSLNAFLTGHDAFPQLASANDLLKQFLLYFPVSFALEEVVFRGAIDPYVSNGETLGWGAFGSALLVSTLWGLWHLPIVGELNIVNAFKIVLFHASIGPTLSYAKRLSGTLALPAVAHAAIDAYRNVLMA